MLSLTDPSVSVSAWTVVADAMAKAMATHLERRRIEFPQLRSAYFPWLYNSWFQSPVNGRRFDFLNCRQA
jgi:hypothetical protein